MKKQKFGVVKALIALKRRLVRLLRRGVVPPMNWE